MDVKKLMEIRERRDRGLAVLQREDFADLQTMEQALGNVISAMLERNDPPIYNYVEPRQVAKAKTHFEEGFAALYRSLGAIPRMPDLE